MRLLCSNAITATGVLSVALCLALAAVPDAPSARAAVEAAIADLLTVLRSSDLSADQKGRRIDQIAEEHFDLDALSRLSLGQSWRDLPEDKRVDFQKEFKKHVLGICRHSASRYTDQDLVIADERKEKNGDLTIRTNLIGSTKSNSTRRELAKIDFRLRKKEQNWKVIDATVSGISLAGGFHAQFQAVMKEGGIDKVLQILRQKNAEADTVPPK